MVRWCLQLPAFPLSPPKGVLWSYIYHLVWGGSSLSWEKRLNMASLPLKCSSGLQNSKQQQKFMNQSDIYHLVLFGWELSTLLPVCLRRLFLTFLGFSRRELSSKKLFVSEGNSFCLFHSLLSGGHGGRI